MTTAEEIAGVTEQLAALLIRLSRETVATINEAEQSALTRLNAYVPTDRLLTLEEAAAYLRMKPRCLDEGTRPHREPVMPFIIQGGKKKFRKISLDAELERLERKPRAAVL